MTCDVLPRDPKNPFDPSNRRFSVIATYLDQQPGESDAKSGAAEGGSSHGAASEPANSPGKAVRNDFLAKDKK